MNFGEFFVKLILPSAAALGEPALEGLINQVAQVDAENFELDIQATYRIFKRLDVFSKQSKTSIDDMITETVLAAIQGSAATNGIDLTAPAPLRPAKEKPEDI